MAMIDRCKFIHNLTCEQASMRLGELEDENAKLRELILDMLVDEERGHNDDYTYYEHVRLAKELGIGVE